MGQLASESAGVMRSGGQDWREPETRDIVLPEFRFHTGEVMLQLRVRVTTLGHPDGAPVLVLHGTGGEGRSLLSGEFGGELFGPGQPLDAARHRIVLPDAIGHGGSAKPSDGLRAAFPAYDYDDMVEAHHRVLVEALGIERVRVVLGVSMGGMLTWIWGIRYPLFMDALVPLASLPAPMSGRNWMLRRLLIDAIRNDPHWKEGNYGAQPQGVRAAWEFFNLATNGGTLALQKAAPTREAADRWLAARRAASLAFDANDLLYQFQASRNYDPSAHLVRIRAPLLAINSTDDERNPPETMIAASAIERLANARLHIVRGSENTRGHGTVGLAGLWAPELDRFLATVPSPTASLHP